MKAMTMTLTGDAEVIEESEHLIRSASSEWKLPSVIRQLKKFKRSGKIQFSRVNIYMRDAWTCQYCLKKKKAKELTFDHVLPRSQGGKTSWTNIVTACKPCNSRKDDRTPEQANLKLPRPPEMPKWLPAQVVIKTKDIPKQWESYVDTRSSLYWTVDIEDS